MTKVLLSVHVIAAILAIGPIAVAASLFPRYARRPLPDGDDAGEQTAGVAAFLHRICRGYAVGIVVPVFGFGTGAQLGVLTDPWLIASIILTAMAAAVLVLAILPGQRHLLASISGRTSESGTSDGSPRSMETRLAALTGVFNILWTIVVVLMIVRPGSTTGV
ncbi:hypothetical protein [Actinomadura alba]|uniref:DUF2269 family protein n=1 Tax=Actinomadura alba TaxID=406431 RepID=A0ABR7LTX2_9ACTN|nr:hypothetical protein [Actinomadura alba]MBC6467952.1 hypothetical protein [Actinomadura alba]